MTGEGYRAKIGSMSDYFRAGVGLILGVTVGLLIVTLLDDTLLRHGHGVSGSVDVFIVVFVSVVEFAAGLSSGGGSRRG